MQGTDRKTRPDLVRSGPRKNTGYQAIVNERDAKTDQAKAGPNNDEWCLDPGLVQAEIRCCQQDGLWNLAAIWTRHLERLLAQ